MSQQGITCSQSRSVQPAPIHTMSSSTTVRVRPRTQTRLYLAYRGCGRLKHGDRCGCVTLQPQCVCEHITLITYSTREALIKACHCGRKGIPIKSRKNDSYRRCSGHRPGTTKSGQRDNIGGKNYHAHQPRLGHQDFGTNNGLRREHARILQRARNTCRSDLGRFRT